MDYTEYMSPDELDDAKEMLYEELNRLSEEYCRLLELSRATTDKHALCITVLIDYLNQETDLVDIKLITQGMAFSKPYYAAQHHSMDGISFTYYKRAVSLFLSFLLQQGYEFKSRFFL